MSSKASIFLTNDNEHCYEETNEPHYDGEKFKGFTIVMEMSKKNIKVVTNDEDDLVIEILPGSELYDIIKSTQR